MSKNLSPVPTILRRSGRRLLRERADGLSVSLAAGLDRRGRRHLDIRWRGRLRGRRGWTRIGLSHRWSGLALTDGPTDFLERLAPGAFAVGDVARDGLKGVGAVGEQFERVHLFEEAPFEGLGVVEALERLSGYSEEQTFVSAGWFVVLG
jgi:hypothetical protein